MRGRGTDGGGTDAGAARGPRISETYSPMTVKRTLRSRSRMASKSAK